MQWYNVILEIVIPLIGLVGGGVGIIYWRENKALKAAEVKDKLMGVELQQAEAWQKLYQEQSDRNKDKSNRLRELYQLTDEQKNRILQLEFECERRNWYRCTVDGCHKRRPPHIFGEDGEELPATDTIAQSNQATL